MTTVRQSQYAQIAVKALTSDNAISSSYALTASYALNGGGGGSSGSISTGSLLVTASFSNPNLTFTKGNNSTFNVNLVTLVPTSASHALTASYVNPLNQNVIVTGSLFLTSTNSNIFLIRNQSNIPVLTVSQSGVVVLSTQSTELIGNAPNGAIYFTSSSFYIGLD